MTIVSLAEVALFTPGFAFKSSDFGEYETKAIKIADVASNLDAASLSGVNVETYSEDRLKKYRVIPGDSFIAMTGSIGKVGRLRYGCAYLNQRVLGIRPNAKIDKDYLWYILNTQKFKHYLLSHIDSHSVQANISAKSIGHFLFSLPSLAIQQKIAVSLRTIDEKIALNNRINDYLAALLNASFVECLSDGYNEVKLPEVVEILSGGTPKTKIPDYWDGGTIPFFAPGDASDSVYTLTTEKHITDAGLENCNSSLYPVGTVFLTARGTVGKIAIAGRPMAMNQSCFAFLGKGIPQSIVFQIIRNAIKSLRAKANGATFAALSTRDLAVETVYLPTTASIDLYDASASVWLETIRTNEEESLRLVALRDALLPKLMSGEIDVSQVDITQLNNHLCDC